MNNTNKKIIGLIPVVLFLLIFVSIDNNTIDHSTQSYQETNVFGLETSGFWNLTGSPIYIDDTDPNFNWSKTASENDWCSGYGNSSNPYVIQDVILDGQGTGTCIEIKNSNVYFRIKNCSLYNAEIGISITNSNNYGIIFDVEISNLIGTLGSTGSTAADSNGGTGGVGSDSKGIVLDTCSKINITSCRIENINPGQGGTGGQGAIGRVQFLVINHPAGWVGGIGGNGGTTYGIQVIDSNDININNCNISDIKGGKGGTGGRGGDAINFARGGNGGNGGSGGSSYGIYCLSSNKINLSSNEIVDVNGGIGGTGGAGGTKGVLNYGGTGGTGGTGGSSLIMYGRYITNSLVNSNKIIDSQGASGGTGGNGGSDNGVRGDGGNGAIYHMGSFFQDSSNITFNSNDVENILGGYGGSIGSIYSGGSNGVNGIAFGSCFNNLDASEITNNSINNTNKGLSFYAGCNSNLIYENNISNCIDEGLFMDSINYNNNISSNFIIDNTDYGIYIAEYNNGSINDNIIENTNCGFYLGSGSNFNILPNTITNTYQYGYRFGTLNNYELSDFTLDGCDYGIYINTGNNVNITDVTLTSNSLYGIKVDNLNGGWIYDVDTNYCGYGIYIGSGVNVSINDNTILSSTEYGLWINTLNEGDITNNTIDICKGGLYLGSGTDFTILPNTITNASDYGYRFGTLNNYELSDFTLVGCDYGIYIDSGNNVNITNVTLNNNSLYGICIISLDTGNIHDVDTNYCRYGIYIGTGVNISINDNTFYDSSEYGLWFTSLNDCEIINNEINICKGGMYVGSGTDFTILPNIIINVAEYGYRFGTLNNYKLSDFTLDGCDYGIFISTGNNLTFTNLTLNDNSLYGIKVDNLYNGVFYDITISNGGCGIYIGTGDNLTLYNNILNSNTQYGIQINDNVNNTRIFDNVANYSTYGFYLGVGQNNSIHDNIARYNDYGYFFDGIGVSSYNISILRNMAQDNNEYNMYIDSIYFIEIKDYDFTTGQHGLVLINCGNNTITNNNFSYHTNHGILLISSDYNNITHNLISDNPGIGITLEDDGSESNFNLVYNNTFINNGFNAVDYAPNNNWNTTIIGNYWSSYGGVDADDNGVGDTPYAEILGSANSKDFIPIWWDAPILSIEELINYTFYSGGVAPNYTLNILEGKGDLYWYSIIELSEISNKTILSHTYPEVVNGSINQGIWNNLTDGTYTLRFYVNDSRGFLSTIEIIFYNDITNPSIKITQPVSNQKVGMIASDLSINVSIVEPNIESTWCNIGNGLINFTFIWNGEINQTLWEIIWNSTATNGFITIKIYANDSVGNLGTTYVSVIKYVPTISDPGTPGGGGDSGMLMLIVIVGSVIAAAIIGSAVYVSRKKKFEMPVDGKVKKMSVYGFRDRVQYLKETNPYYEEVKSSIEPEPKPKKGMKQAPAIDKITKDPIIIEEVEDVDIIDEPPLTDAELIENILKVSQKDVEFVHNGKRFEAIGNFEEAIKCYDQAVQVNPKNIDAWVNKRNALEKIGELEKANECKNKIYELRKDG